MIVKHIKDENSAGDIDKMIKQGKQVFILVYMEGCGPCNATRPEWAKLESALNNQYKSRDNVAIIDVDQSVIQNVKNIGPVEGFPTMKYICNNGDDIETYEDSSIKKKDRSVDSFINWVESKITKTVSLHPTSSPHKLAKRLSMDKKSRKSLKGGKRLSKCNKLTKNNNKTKTNKKMKNNKKTKCSRMASKTCKRI